VEQPEVEKLVGELELGVDRLRSLYEQYFMGIEKIEPAVPRKDVDRRIHVLRKEQIRNTALRFRFQMIVQRYNTYQTHWQRICREIENGTYKRHMVRARARFESSRPPSRPPPAAEPKRAPAPLGFPEPGAALPQDLAAELADLEREFGPVMPLGALAARPAPATAPAAPAARPGPPAPSPPARPPAIAPPAQARAAAPPLPPPRAPLPTLPGLAPEDPAPTPARPPAPATAPAPAPAARPPEQSLPDERVRALYAQYVDAKRRQNESTAAITYEAVARSLRDSGAKLREKHGKAVDFEVAVKDGKAILKPVLK
jgi:hypothetical protein